MLATLHYYNNYKPLILDMKKSRERDISSYKSYKIHNKTPENKEVSYFLNKSLNDDVKAYMFELSSNFNSLKNISNKMYETFYYNSLEEPLKDNLQKFASTYNRFVGFLDENTESSTNFENILNDTKTILDENIEILNDLGIKMNDSGFLNISSNENINKSNIDTDKTKRFYLNLYDKMCDFMKQPMSNHMEFKDFSYYFNYSGDYNKNKSFKLIEQGLLVDISL